MPFHSLCLLLLSSLASVAAVDVMSMLAQLADHGREEGLRGTWVPHKKMPMYVSLPSKAEPSGHTFVIVAHHAVGIYNDVFLRGFCDDLATEGFVCLLPDFFWRTWSKDIPTGFGIDVGEMNIAGQVKGQKDSELVEDVLGAIDFAKEVSGTTEPVNVAVVGFCMGGRISWLAGTAKALAKDVKGVVAYHGGNLFKAYPEDAGTAPGDNLKDLSCPVLGHFAKLDQNPSPADQERLEAEGAKLGKELEFYSYSGVKHGFSCKDSSAYNWAAAKEAWPRTVDFLKRVLSADDTDNDADPHGFKEL